MISYEFKLNKLFGVKGFYADSLLKNLLCEHGNSCSLTNSFKSSYVYRTLG